VIWGDDIGITNLSCYSDGLMGYRTPNIDRVAAEGMRFTDSYGEQCCTAGRSSFITGQSVYRTGMSKVGFPGADVGLSAEDPTIAELLKPLGYATGQFGKNHLGDLGQYGPSSSTAAIALVWHSRSPRRATRRLAGETTYAVARASLAPRRARAGPVRAP
jgi:arylsulfatase